MKMSSAVTLNGADEDPINRGIRELLATLPQNELASLLNTVTNTLVQFGSVPKDANGKPLTDPTTHAINSILMYGDAISLLNRTRMKKKYLSDYLNQKQVRMTTPHTKNSLCRDIMNYWGQQVPDNVQLIEDETPRRRSVQNSQSVPAASAYTPENGRTRLSEGGSGISSPSNQTSVAVALGAQSPGSSIAQTHNQELINMEYQNALSLRQREAELGLQLGMEFSAWYYERLNTLTDFNASHFWQECNFRLEMIFATEPDKTVIDEIMANGEATCAKIKDLVAVKGLYFDPNKTVAGIRGYLNPHGLGQVMVCGTIHTRNRDEVGPVGVFEQMFGLMKDPRFGNNYKIKFSVLRLREGNHLAIQGTPPELVDSSLVGIVEEIDDD